MESFSSCQLPVARRQLKTRKTLSAWLVAGLVAALGLLAAAQLRSLPGVAHIETPARVEARAHAVATAVVTVRIDPGFHIQSNHPKLDYLIPSSLTLTPANGVTLTKVSWPAAQDHTFSFSKDPLAVFEGTLKVPVTLHTGAAGNHVLHGTFRYQACNDQMCRPPVSQPFTLDVQVR